MPKCNDVTGSYQNPEAYVETRLLEAPLASSPAMKLPRRNRVLLLVTAGVLGLTILFFRTFPIGVSYLPYAIASIDKGHSIPGRSWEVVYNDAGAAHSGNFWTWVIADRIFYRVVVAEGYSNADVYYEQSPFPARQMPHGLEIGFAKGRRDSEIQWQTVPGP